MATKYEKLEAEYQQLSTPEQQWAWVLAHEAEVKLKIGDSFIDIEFKKCVMDDVFISHWPKQTLKALLSVLGIEVEEVWTHLDQ